MRRRSKRQSLLALIAFMSGLFLLTPNQLRAESEKHEGGHEAPADDHGSPKDGGHKAGEKKEEGGHGAAAEKAPLAPWAELETKIQTLEAKIQSKKQTLKSLIEEKAHLPEKSPHLKSITQEIGKTDRELRALLEDYEKSLTILKYRFPERHAKGDRKYDRSDVPKVEDVEKALGLEGRLNKSLKKMRSQYPPPPNIKKQKLPDQKLPDGETKTNPSIEDSPPIIIKK